MDILQITKPTEYFKRLEIIRQGKPKDIKQILAEVKDPFEMHPAHVKKMPFFLDAQQSAVNGAPYCFWCASNHLVKAGHKEKTKPDNFSFKCKDCNSAFTYKMPKAKYDAFNGFTLMKKGKYKPRKK